MEDCNDHLADETAYGLRDGRDGITSLLSNRGQNKLFPRAAKGQAGKGARFSATSP